MEYSKWWTDLVNIKSKELWLPSITRNIRFTTFANNIQNKSWFNVINQSINQPDNHFNMVELTDALTNLSNEQISENKEDPVNSIIKIKLLPTPEQRSLLRKMFYQHRYIYNTLVSKSKDDCYKLNKTELDRKYRKYTTKRNFKDLYENEFIHDTIETTYNSTWRDFNKAIDSSKALYKKLEENNINTTFPKLSFKSRKYDESTSIEIRPRDINVASVNNRIVRFLPNFFKFKRITEDITNINTDYGFKYQGIIPEFINYSCRLQMLKTGQFYLIIPQSKQFNQFNNNLTCAIDPRVRNFITTYDTEGYAFSIKAYEEDKTKNKLWLRLRHIDKLNSILSKHRENRKRKKANKDYISIHILHSNKLKRIKKTVNNLYKKIKNMIKDCHHKISKWLALKYNQILLPTFGTKSMVSKSKKLSKFNRRMMNTWSHYKFKLMLKYKVERYGGQVINCNEEYTSKTCSKCGKVNDHIKMQEVFKCKNCNCEIDRDVNGARNIYLKNFSLFT